MENSILTQQLNSLRVLVLDHLKKSYQDIEERIYFSRPFYYVDPNNYNFVYNVSGFEKNSLIIDSYYFDSNITITENNLPIDLLIEIKKELETCIENKKINDSLLL